MHGIEQDDVCGVLVYLLGILDVIHHHFGRNAERDVLSALYREVDEMANQLLCASPSNQQLFEALQEAVKRHRMTWFHFAQSLLHSTLARPFIFEIANYTGGES